MFWGSTIKKRKFNFSITIFIYNVKHCINFTLSTNHTHTKILLEKLLLNNLGCPSLLDQMLRWIFSSSVYSAFLNTAPGIFILWLVGKHLKFKNEYKPLHIYIYTHIFFNSRKGAKYYLMTHLMKVMWTPNVKIDSFLSLELIFTLCFLLHFKIHCILFVVVTCPVPKNGLYVEVPKNSFLKYIFIEFIGVTLVNKVI